MIATSIEQSKHLLELGLDPKTADCNWNITFGDWSLCIGKNKLPHAVPAWSLFALLEVMRKLKVVFTLQITEMATWLRIKDLGFIWQKDIHIKNPIDAVYGGMLWLLEQGLIKKGE